MTTFNSTHGAITTTTDLDALNRSQLVDVYNELTGEARKQFRTKGEALKKVGDALATWQAENAPAKPVSPTTSTGNSDGSKRRKRMNFPVKSEIKNHREGTKRAMLIEMLSRKNGADFEELMEATGWDYKTCYEGVKLLHSYVGYGLREDENGRIRLIVAEGGE